MGHSSAPQAPTIQQQPQKPVIYMRNRYLDGLGIDAENSGRNSLRIDRTAPARSRNPAMALGLGIGGP